MPEGWSDEDCQPEDADDGVEGVAEDDDE